MDLEIINSIRAITNSINLLERLSSVSEKNKNSEISLVIAELRNELALAKITAAKANEQIADLMRENRDLKDEVNQLSSPPELTEGKDGLYYKGGSKNPYCPNCAESKKATLLTKDQMGWGFLCQSCKWNNIRIGRRYPYNKD